MDWARAIDRNRTALLAAAAAILALLGGPDGGPIARRMRAAALALLRPAEAALRRLIVIAARGLAPAPAAPRPAFVRPAGGPRADVRPPAFPLFDPLKRFGPPPPPPPRGIPRIRTFWGPLSAQPISPPFPLAPLPAVSPDPDDLVEVDRLRQRLRSFERALHDLPRQARRFVRWRARRGIRPPLRPGRPPGQRRDRRREIDLVLGECHALACDALQPDTS